MKTLTILSAAFCLCAANAQPRVPNLGDKQCPLWIAVIDKAKEDRAFKAEAEKMDWWALGYLKGMGNQFAASENVPNPLTKLRGNEETEWMRAYCRVNPKELISDAARKLLEELQARP